MMTPRPLPCVLVLVAALGGAVASAQSLGELAKQEEARRKAIKSSGKIYTNDSIRAEPAPSRPATPPATKESSAPADAAAPATDAAAPAGEAGAQAGDADGAKGEAYWKKRITAARDSLARSQMFAEALQSRINALITDFTARDDPAQRAVIAADRQKALAELDRVKQEIQQSTKSIAGIQEEARRAGVPPGWLR